MKSGRKHRNTGGTDDAKEDLDDKPEARTNAKKIDEEAEERKSGGRARAAGGRTARKHGGKTEMKVEGKKAEMHAGRKPRKNGGRTGSDGSPFTTARHGKMPAGRSEMDLSEG
jgi:hypothetical protein